jgi:hypothetical protein
MVLSEMVCNCRQKSTATQVTQWEH